MAETEAGRNKRTVAPLPGLCQKRRDQPESICLKPARNRKRGNRPPGRTQPPAEQAAAKPVGSERQRPAFRQGKLPAERLPVILEVGPDENYALIDSGDGEKLERFGEYRVVRPEGQAIWPRALPQPEWQNVDAIFTGDTDEEGLGRWRFPKQPLGETWPMRHDGIENCLIDGVVAAGTALGLARAVSAHDDGCVGARYARWPL